MLNYEEINKLAKKYEPEMVSFLRDIVAIPSTSGKEERVIARIRQEMEKTGAFDRIWTDPMGNLLGQVGTGPRLIAIDAHIDTVDIGNPAEWKHHPFEGKVEDGFVYGRGAGDQEGAVAPMVYAGKIIKDLGLKSDQWATLFTFTVQEEDCDGLCWQYIINKDNIRPECVVITDSTNTNILRGHRGRMEIGVTVHGRSAHGSMPHKGDNAAYKIAKIITEIEKLNKTLKKDDFLGKGTISVSYVDCKTPSLCAVPNQAYIHLDRRLTVGETMKSALREVREAVKRAGINRAEVKVLHYAKPSWTGLVYETQSYFPTWVFPESDPQVQAAIHSYERLFNKKPKISRWTFSTNGVAIAGIFGIPCVGFGPAEEDVAHTVNDRVPIEHLVKCAAFYAAYPEIYCSENLPTQKQTEITNKAASNRIDGLIQENIPELSPSVG